MLATASRDNTAQVWDTATGRALHTLTGHSGTAGDVTFSPDGHLPATTSNDTARLWE
jgi:WD40 repeat protein